MHSDSKLTINLQAIVNNYKLLAKKSVQAECSAVVKANAYGLGVKQVSLALEEAGCKKFFVATLDEAIELRNTVKNHPIYIFHGLFNNQPDILDKYNLIPVINNNDQLKIWQNHATNKNKEIRAILHVDTGINRLGFSMNKVEKLGQSKAELSGLKIEYFMSHFACASTPNFQSNKDQIERLRKIKQLFPKYKFSMANSSGIMAHPDSHFDLTRPGCALYGIHPVVHQTDILQHTATLTAKIIQIRDLKKGDHVGYGATWQAQRNSRIAIIPVGYADGYLRYLGNKSRVYLHNQYAPVIGRISMDMIEIDITNIPQAKLYDAVELMGDHITVDELAEKAETIGYEIFTSLGKRFDREYI